MPIVIGAKRESDFTDPIGMLGDCHRRIEMFLNVERLSAGQMELKKESFDVGDLMTTCVDRVRPLAERKQIHIQMDPPEHDLVAQRGRI